MTTLPVKEAPVSAEELPIVRSSMEDGLLVRTVQFRGVLYKLRELEVGEFTEVTDNSKVKRMLDGNEIEVVDNALQARLMLKECLLEPKVKQNKIPTRVMFTLNRLINEMHFDPEPDELEKKPDDEEKPTGNR